MLFNNDIELQNILNNDYGQIPTDNIHFGGKIYINNKELPINSKELPINNKELSINLKKKMNNKYIKNLIIKDNLRKIDNIYSKKFKINNQKLNQKMLNLKMLNLKISKDCIHFDDVLIKDLNIKLKFKKNNISELYSGASYDYEPEDTIINLNDKVNIDKNLIKELDPDILMYIDELTSKEINYLIKQNNLKKKYKLGKYALKPN